MKKLLSALLVLTVLFAACGKDDNDTTSSNTYPKNANIMYKITAVKGSVDTLQSGSYSNISGGTTHLENIALPFTQTISKTVNRADIVTLSFFHNNSATSSPFSIKLEIWVNNQVAKTQTFEGTSALNEAIVYVFQ